MTIDAETTTMVTGRGQAARIALYVREMFPPLQMVPYATFHFFAIWFSLQALGSGTPVRVTWTSLRGVITVLLFLLLMRLYDELKDAATDVALGRAGDPLYRDRVLVTGAVLIEDVRVLRWLVTAALVIVNLRPGLAFAAFWIVFGVMWLSFNWFFWPSMSRNILLAFVTHNPIALLVSGYVVALFADEFGWDPLGSSVPALMVGLWLPLAAWETSRKIRAPEDETSYQTYSRVLGWKTAAWLPAIFVTGAAVCLIFVARAAGLGVPFSAAIVLVGGMVVFRCALFRMAPSRRHAALKPWTIFFATTANAGLVVATVAARGVTW